MKNSQKGFATIPLIIAIIATLAVGGGVVYYATKTPAPSSNTEENNFQPEANQNQQQTNTQTPQVTIPKSETANWKTIKDSFNEVTYEFKLPSDFEPRSANPEIWRFFSNNKYQFEIFIHPERSEFSLEKTLADMDAVSNTVGEGGPRVLSKQNIIVDGLPAIQRKQNVIYEPFSSAQTVSTYLLVNRHLVALTIKSQIDTNSDPEIFQAATLTASDVEFYSKVLSTFKFTSPSATFGSVNTEDAVNQYAYITKFYNQNGQNFIDVDYIDLDFTQMADGYPRLTNNNPKIRTFQVSNQVKIEDRFTNVGMGVEPISLKEHETRLANYKKQSGKQLYVQITAENGVVNLISIPWRP